MVKMDFRAAFVGQGPDVPDVAALGERIELLGARSDVPELLCSSDVFVLSSRSEAFPISILEAMAAGLAVVATDVGGVAEAVVHGETGLLVPPGDPHALAEALDLLLRDPDLRRRLGSSGRARAQRLFDQPAFRRAHLELYHRELARSGLPEADAGTPRISVAA
jgi:glycosyltransferase involved in cell wall biosynthesis